MDMSRYKTLFLNDVGEHLQELEQLLLRLEKQPADRPALDEVFRHLHSVKGMAAAMNYQPMSRLAHDLEELADGARSAAQQLAPAQLEMLLQGLDLLRDQLQAVRQEQPLPEAPSELVLALRRGPEAAAAPTAPATPEKPSPPAPPAADGGRNWHVEITMDSECEAPAVRAFVALQRLARLGRVLECRPEQHELRSGHLPGGKLEVLLEAATSAEHLTELARNIIGVAELKAHPQQAGAPSSAGSAPERTSVVPNSVRVQTDLLDFFFDSVGELITLLSFFEETSAGTDSPGLRHAVRRLGRVVRRLRDRVFQVRLVPLSVLTARLPRVCRDLARQQGKQVELTIHGQEVELDRAIVEALDAPLLHLIRNAIDHGLESPEDRRAAGKPSTGRLQLDCQRQGDRVVLQLGDDGSGIDLERVRQRARQLGLLADGSAASRQQLLEFLFRPGFSTRQETSEVSGRGVGLDVVRRDLERLGGGVRIWSAPGQGTRFTIDLPLSLAIVPVLLVETEGAVLALPAQRVQRVQAVGSEPASDKPPFAWLDELLGSVAPAPRQAAECVYLGSGETTWLCLGVERVAGHHEVVVKPLGRLLATLGPYSGAAVLGDGRPALVLDVERLVRQRQLGG